MHEPKTRAYLPFIPEALLTMASRIIFAAAVQLTLLLPIYAADNPAIAPNSDPIYQQLRNLTLSGEAMSVSNFELKRDVGTFHLHSGTVCFVAPVQGRSPEQCFQAMATLSLTLHSSPSAIV